MKKILLVAFITLSVGLQARFHSIESEHEFEQKIDDFDYSLVCFADSKSHAGGRIKDTMSSMASSGEFKSLLHDRFGFLFVRTERDRNHELARHYHYDGKPLFIIFERDQKLISDTLNRDYSRRSISNFIEKELAHSLKDIKDDVRAERKNRSYRSEPRVHIGFGTGYYPGYGYYRGGRPYWWHRRYGGYRRPYYGGYGYRHRPGFYFGIGN